jgi:hypothetical protein
MTCIGQKDIDRTLNSLLLEFPSNFIGVLPVMINYGSWMVLKIV